jgi:hypothetical protein
MLQYIAKKFIFFKILIHEKIMKLNEQTGLYENYGTWHIPFWQTHSFKLKVAIFLGIVILCVIILLVKKYLAYRRRKKLPSWEQALRELNYLKQERKINVEHGKEFYLTVSAILKKYLSERFSYDLIGLSDTESIQYLEKKIFDKHFLEKTKSILQGGETIKFANAQAAQEQIEKDYLGAITIIQQTIPKK